MKKLILAIIVSLVLTAGAFAQDIAAPQAPASKQKTFEELQWQAQALQNEYLYLQERMNNIKTEFQRVSSELAELKKAQKPVEPKPEPPIDKKEKK